MSETLTRLLSGIVYAVLLLLAIFVSEISFTILIFIFGAIALFELQRLLNLQSYLSFILMIGFFLFLRVFDLPYRGNILKLLMIGTLIINLLLIRDLMAIRKIPVFESRKYLIVIFYLIASLIFLTLIPYQNSRGIYEPSILIGIFVLIWSNDSFAYLIGKSIGKHKLFERISPNKTIEGFIGGLICTLLVGLLIHYITQIYTYQIWLGLALVTGIFGTFGDLIQSKLKRQAGVKDSGRVMPGHGGLLDRLDSIIFASSFIYSFLVIVNHVS